MATVADPGISTPGACIVTGVAPRRLNPPSAAGGEDEPRGGSANDAPQKRQNWAKSSEGPWHWGQ